MVNDENNGEFSRNLQKEKRKKRHASNGKMP